MVTLVYGQTAVRGSMSAVCVYKVHLCVCVSVVSECVCVCLWWVCVCVVFFKCIYTVYTMYLLCGPFGCACILLITADQIAHILWVKHYLGYSILHMNKVFFKGNWYKFLFHLSIISWHSFLSLGQWRHVCSGICRCLNLCCLAELLFMQVCCSL